MKKAVLAGAALLAAPIAAGVAATEAPPASEMPAGERIYNETCVYCHDRRGWGTRALSQRVPEGQAVLTERETLPAAFTSLVVRQGIGSMPPFTPTDLSDEEIAAVAEWLERGR